MSKRLAKTFVVLTMAAVAIGCSKAAKQTTLMTYIGELEMPARELRVRTYEFVDHFGGAVEMAADGIIASTNDPVVHRNALIWKISAIPEMHKAVFQLDPFGALIDAWVLCAQMTQYFKEGEGNNLFGEWQPIAVDTSEQLETDIAKIAMMTAGGDVSDGAEFVADWVAKHPITNQAFIRESTIAYWAEYTAREGEAGLGAIASFDESMTDLSDRMRIYGAHIPKQTQWQAELLFAELASRSDVTDFTSNVSSIEESAREIKDVFIDAPKIVAEERALILKELEFQFARFTELLEKERMTIMSGVTEERIAVFEALQEERIAVMKEIGELTGQALDQTSKPLTDVIDHFFLRLVQFTVVVLLVLVILRLIDLRLARRRPS